MNPDRGSPRHPFGVGYSSLALLRRLPISTLKIDRSFVSELASNQQDVATVEAVITMANSMGLRTVAEGVEDEAQKVALRVLGCDDGQGSLQQAGREHRGDGVARVRDGPSLAWRGAGTGCYSGMTPRPARLNGWPWRA